MNDVAELDVSLVVYARRKPLAGSTDVGGSPERIAPPAEGGIR